MSWFTPLTSSCSDWMLISTVDSVTINSEFAPDNLVLILTVLSVTPVLKPKFAGRISGPYMLLCNVIPQFNPRPGLEITLVTRKLLVMSIPV